jgi:CheY-like chemotaxis protein
MGWTVLLVDDHAAFRAAARELLESAGCVVVGEAVDGGSAVQMAHRLRPDALLLDVQLPDMDGFEVAAELGRQLAPCPLIVLTSTRSASSYRRRLAASDVAGFLAKTDLTVANLQALLPPAVPA